MSEESFGLLYGHAASNWGDLAINYGVRELFLGAGKPLRDVHVGRLSPSAEYAALSAASLEGMLITDWQASAGRRGGRDEIAQLATFLAHPEEYLGAFGIPGGSHLFINSGEHLFMMGQGSSIDLYWRILPLIAAEQACLPLSVLPSTVGPFYGSFGKAIVGALNGRNANAALRDSESAALVGGLGLSGLPVLMDPGFFSVSPGLPRLAGADVETIGLVVRLEDFGLRPGAKRSAFVDAKHRGSNYNQSQAYSVFKSVALGHLLKGGAVKLIVQTRADREITVALYEDLGNIHGEAGLSLWDGSAYADYLAVLEEVDAVISARFHSVLLALGLGTPAVGAYFSTHGHKMLGLFGLLGHGSGAVRIDHRHPSLVSEELMSSLFNLLEVQGALFDRIVRMKKETQEWFGAQLARRAHNHAPSNLNLVVLSELVKYALQYAYEHELREVASAIRALRVRDDGG